MNVENERSLTPKESTIRTPEIALLREMLERERQNVEYLQKKLDQVENERQELTLRLENKPKKRFLGLF